MDVEEILALEGKLSVIALTEAYIRSAHMRGASDIHIDPRENELILRFRVDGLLIKAYSFPKKLHAECIARLKILAGLRTDEHFIPQDGRFRIELRENEWVDVRISIAPTYYGENAVLRLLSTNTESLTLLDLGFSKAQERLLSRTLTQTDGMILVTGPTGSGKTTTLYALMRTIAHHPLSLVTIEDPIEYSMDGVNQMQTNHQTGFTFARGLRSILRQDPDVLMVGEIRDQETAGLAINAALTGHLIFSTLHTIDAASTLPRLLDMQIEPYIIASTVRLVIAQRLIRRICPGCRMKYSLSTDQRAHLANEFDSGRELPEILYRGAGCSACGGSGYKGRVGIYELLLVTSDLEHAIARRASARELRKIAQSAGMQSLETDGLAKVANGLTTIEELIRIRHD